MKIPTLQDLEIEAKLLTNEDLVLYEQQLFDFLKASYTALNKIELALQVIRKEQEERNNNKTSQISSQPDSRN